MANIIDYLRENKRKSAIERISVLMDKIKKAPELRKIKNICDDYAEEIGEGAFEDDDLFSEIDSIVSKILEF